MRIKSMRYFTTTEFRENDGSMDIILSARFKPGTLSKNYLGNEYGDVKVTVKNGDFDRLRVTFYDGVAHKSFWPTEEEKQVVLTFIEDVGIKQRAKQMVAS